MTDHITCTAEYWLAHAPELCEAGVKRVTFTTPPQDAGWPNPFAFHRPDGVAFAENEYHSYRWPGIVFVLPS